MNTHVKELLARMAWPGVDSITYGDGTMVLLDIDFFSNRTYSISPIADSSIESYLKYNADFLSPFDVTAKADDESYEIYAGDSSDESNGVVYVIDKLSRQLVWFAFFERSAPFLSVSFDAGFVAAVTSAGVAWRINLENPLDIQLIF